MPAFLGNAIVGLILAAAVGLAIRSLLALPQIRRFLLPVIAPTQALPAQIITQGAGQCPRPVFRREGESWTSPRPICDICWLYTN